MADPRPTADDPLVIFGSVSLPMRQGPSTVNPPTSGGIPTFGDPQLGCSCLCCPPMPPGCPIGPLPCEYQSCGSEPNCCNFTPDFPPLFSCGATCSPASSYSLVLDNSCSQTFPAGDGSANGCCGINLSFQTITHNRGFNIAICPCVGTSSITIPKTGLWSISVRTREISGTPVHHQLVLKKCAVKCARFDFDFGCVNMKGFGFTNVNTYNAGEILLTRARQDNSTCLTLTLSEAHMSLYLVGESC